ncbi:hypothetical protein OI18_14340 [Flavihumibacter solisilvae]|uniref:ATP synthase subunit I n=1 Tax=Flavihumibacter solisilvae TaxID=1349421 RepID=A0A0C1L3H5_9BACT|nr:hypothetical protein OI18_14340 [Flavihumibacter solisilvae]
MLIVFLVVNGLLLVFRQRMDGLGVDTAILLTGNLILFVIFLLSFVMHARSAENSSTPAFLRSVYGGMLLKLFGGATAAFVYIFLFRDKVNKPALFGCMFLYMLYTFIELRVVLKKSKTS